MALAFISESKRLFSEYQFPSLYTSSNHKPDYERASVTMPSIDQLFNEAFQPFRQDRGTAYTSSQSEIDFHKRALFPSRNRGPFVNEADASEYMMHHNCLTKRIRTSEQAAIDRLAKVMRDLHKGGFKWGPDFAIKAFSDLDLVFFGGHLAGNGCVTWSSDETDARLGTPTRDHGRLAICLGVTEKRHGCGEQGQCRIVLNAEAIFSSYFQKDPFGRMMGTLLHEMVHAYDYVRCPAAQELDGDGLRHDAHFGTRISVVHDRAERLLRLRVIEEGEPYEQKIFFTKELNHRQDESRSYRSRR